MAVEKLELETYFGKCKCCLNYGYLRTMWEQHFVEGETEVYGNMLVECFAITWTVEHSEADDQICEECVWKLREACKFKKQVLKCHHSEYEAGGVDEDMKEIMDIKPQIEENYEEEYLEEELLDQIPDESDQDESRDGRDGEKSSDENENQDDDDDDFSPSQYDDEDDEKSKPLFLVPRKRSRPSKRAASDSEGGAKPKYKRLPVSERFRTYKMYADEAMESAVDDAVNGRMSQPEAAKHYKVPLKTLRVRIRELTSGFPTEPRVNKHRALYAELRTFLKYTNATPFYSKPHAGTIKCFFCRETFTAPNDLRAHTLTHPNRTDNLEIIMRPIRRYRLVKLDVQHISCTVCDVKFNPSQPWDDSIRHLSEIHGCEFTQRYRIIPYVLGDDGPDCSCVFCHETFMSIKTLDAHINKHYDSYICNTCGECFLTEDRLRMHEKTHVGGRFPCPECKKMFFRESYMKKHFESMHKLTPKFKCRYCEERFRSEDGRHMHTVENHKEHVQVITCELCGAVYNRLKTFVQHMRYKHGKGKSGA